MKTDLIIATTKASGALSRIIGTIERRGFSIIAINTLGEDDETCSLHLRVDGGERSVASLVRHLDKLFDVRCADVFRPALALERPRHGL